MTPEIRIGKTYYPQITGGKTIIPDNGHLYLEYHRLCDTMRDLTHIKDTVMRDVFRDEIQKRQYEILKIVKIN